jgi:peptidyl-dipeptidase Dcp
MDRMKSPRPRAAKTVPSFLSTLIALSVVALSSIHPALAASADFGPSSPLFAPSTLPFEAPPFDRIKNEDFQPAIEAGMAEEESEIQAIANNALAPTFANTIVAIEKSGQLLDRVMAVFDGVTGADTNPTLQKVKAIEAPKLAAHQDFIYLDTKGYVLPLQNTTQQPILASLKQPRDTRQAVFEDSWNRTERGGANDTRATIARLAKLRAEKAKLLGYPELCGVEPEDQMAKTPEPR